MSHVKAGGTSKNIHNYVMATIQEEASVSIVETETELIIDNHKVVYCNDSKKLVTKSSNVINDIMVVSKEPTFAQKYIERFYYAIKFANNQ